jgi:hypothetical protein
LIGLIITKNGRKRGNALVVQGKEDTLPRTTIDQRDRSPVMGDEEGERLLVFLGVVAIGVARWALIERPVVRLSRRLLRSHT